MCGLWGRPELWRSRRDWLRGFLCLPDLPVSSSSSSHQALVFQFLQCPIDVVFPLRMFLFAVRAWGDGIIATIRQPFLDSGIDILERQCLAGGTQRVINCLFKSAHNRSISGSKVPAALQDAGWLEIQKQIWNR